MIDKFGRTLNAGSNAQRGAQITDLGQFVRLDGATSSLNMPGNAKNNLPIPENQYDAANYLCRYKN